MKLIYTCLCVERKTEQAPHQVPNLGKTYNLGDKLFGVTLLKVEAYRKYTKYLAKITHFKANCSEAYKSCMICLWLYMEWMAGLKLEVKFLEY